MWIGRIVKRNHATLREQADAEVGIEEDVLKQVRSIHVDESEAPPLVPQPRQFHGGKGGAKIEEARQAARLHSQQSGVIPYLLLERIEREMLGSGGVAQIAMGHGEDEARAAEAQPDFERAVRLKVLHERAQDDQVVQAGKCANVLEAPA